MTSSFAKEPNYVVESPSFFRENGYAHSFTDEL